MDGLKQLVNNPVIYQSFLQLLDEKISSSQKSLEQATEIADVYRLQGNITALRRLRTLRDEVNKRDK